MSRKLGVLERIVSEPETAAKGGPAQTSPIHSVYPIREAGAIQCSSEPHRDEMYRLVQSVFFSTDGFSARDLVFCGIDSENGSDSVCLSAGRALSAMTSKPVCLLDANLRSPRLQRIVSLGQPVSLEGGTVSSWERCLETWGNLYYAGSGMLANGHGTLASKEDLKELLALLHTIFEYVLIDAPATLTCNDTTTLGQIAGAAIIVLEANRTRRWTARREVEALEAAGVRVLGTVLRNRSFPIPSKLLKHL
jgi:hypothetical protein